jgi:hypothetical protein
VGASEGVISSSLGDLCDSGFLVTLSNCRHLARLVLMEDRSGPLGDCCHLCSLACEGLCAHPRGRSVKSNYSEINQGLERSLVIYHLLCEVVI